MNTGNAATALMYTEIYQAILDTVNEDFEKWMKMDKATLMTHVMMRTKGHYNPTILNKVIQSL